MQKAREVADRKSAIISDSTDSNTNGNNQPIFIKSAVKENTTEKPQWLKDLARKRVNKPQIVEKTKTEGKKFDKSYKIE